jgi:death on curing protein
VTDFVWVEVDDAIAYHNDQIAQHGGLQGIRDQGLLESALSRPQMKAQFGVVDLATLGAAYAYGLARNHPFLDGNKRTALVVMETFLVLNGFEIAADNAEVVTVMLSVAAGEVSEDDLVLWLRSQLVACGA